ncbi:TetR/AcrR family transcriptional regulator [Tianweitania sediminis]|uniref:TetR/AcrR family transcriptional regulator n=1 Tax=Tianweitania sediminis TaxID=1502156 RepID=A0A8J7RH03_9HYPH|nr:TetR/AcrR family transcriptional regulator [Tianweitania sediminis]MBP0437091.1 TetR/AcrR family transcriptional regulator [Tianweitania sediminis]
MIPTATKLIEACEKLLCEVSSLEELTARRIAELAGTAPSAISYHFGSQEQLVIATAERVYKQLNAERLSLLNAAVQRAHPAPPALSEMVGALVGPSVRWSLDPASKYKVLSHFTSMAQRSRDQELYRPLVEGIEHHRVFSAHFRAHAPWLSEAEVGWRISCALGIRSQVTRNRLRNEVLTQSTIDFSDPEEVIARIVEVVVPMFRAPA